MSISPDFSALEAVITAKVQSVSTSINNQDLLVQMKAVELAVSNLSLGRVIAEGGYQQGLLQSEQNTAVTTINTAVTTGLSSINSAITTLQGYDATGLVNTINSAKTTALSAISGAQTTATAAVSSAQTTATAAITDAKNAAITAVSTTAANSAVTAVNAARDYAITQVQTVSTSLTDLANTIKLVRDDRWLGLGIFAPAWEMGEITGLDN